MDLLFKTEPQFSFHDDIMVDNNGGSMDMAKLLRVLCVAECVVRDSDLNNDVGSIEEYVDLFESKNDAFTAVASFPASRQTDTFTNPLSSPSGIPSRSVIISNHNIIRNTDPFEPTPIGPCINVVRDVPISSLFGDRVPPPNENILWPDVNVIKSNSSEDAASIEPLPLATASSIIKNQDASLPNSNLSKSNSTNNNRKFQDEQWKQRFQDLLEFQLKHGHLLVPHAYSENNKLSQWVKRQRYQYRLKQIGRHNTLTDEREELLDSVGFVWDSHQASWNDHYQRLENFFQVHGHVQVPATENAAYSSLSTWCKHQRRQYRNYIQQHQQGSTNTNGSNNNNHTTMTVERIRKLELLGFEWNPRKLTASSNNR